MQDDGWLAAIADDLRKRFQSIPEGALLSARLSESDSEAAHVPMSRKSAGDFVTPVHSPADPIN